MSLFDCWAEPQPCQPKPRDIAHGIPTSEQQEAIALLRDHDVDDVFAYLRYARSARGSSQSPDRRQDHGGGLSPSQVGAVKTLSGCADRKLRTWLQEARSPGTSTTFVCLASLNIRYR